MEVGPAPFIVTLADDPMVSHILEKAVGLHSMHFESSHDFFGAIETVTPAACFVEIDFRESQYDPKTITELRKKCSYCPIIIVTSNLKEDALEQVFRLGADDFVLKPLHLNEIRCRFRTQLSHKCEVSTSFSLTIGDLALNTIQHTISGPFGKKGLTQMEAHILAQLIRAKGAVVPKQVLKRVAWGRAHVSDNAFNRRLYDLRNALKGVSGAVRIQSSYRSGLSLKAIATNSHTFL